MATDIQKSKRHIVRVQINEFGGREFLDIRTYFENKDGEMCPKKNGVTLAPEKAEELANAILGEVARREGAA